MPVTFARVGSIARHRRMMPQLVKHLFSHDRIITTVKRAELAGQEAERLITLAKRNTDRDWSRIWGFFGHDKEMVERAKEVLQRYQERKSGYTRVHKFGMRPGDNADRAILELVDNPRDLKMEMTARAVAHESLRTGYFANPALLPYASGKQFTASDFEEEGIMRFNQITRTNLRKVTLFTGEQGRQRLADLANKYLLWRRAEEAAIGPQRVDDEKFKTLGDGAPFHYHDYEKTGATLMRPKKGKPLLAGQEEQGSSGHLVSPRLVRKGAVVKHSVIRLSKGVYARRDGRSQEIPEAPKPLPKWHYQKA